ncbi:Gfo/Idh/MocA family oxidoreductase [Rubellicoccus peritrichatus]|uniref:Gfo/Idh/MocA family oxidoreductase n=1 Tax=Rubellicoccus peritrichatus TaxID=3080537 RepID=A0AAQ3L887_9BACT|nr:Gfo/Idh/MocA family oxidoreductase [Puniceicoccus sp. CR14]WOO41474.1 Gfo/Idh/MocA family oxidoreductase [Puniceicoccus sp. CR14]
MSDKQYGVSAEKSTGEVAAPALDYMPRVPESYKPKIGLIGAGNISSFHLTAYKALGLDVTAICDQFPKSAEAKQREFYPDAIVYTDYRKLLEDAAIEVVDITTHPDVRFEIIEAALRANKHVLSQKPFVTDLAQGRHLIDLAEKHGVKLAVNQNGRWAPHFRYMTLAVDQGLIGTVNTIDFSLQWDQTWIAGNEGFESIRHMVLYDFAIHWFDITCRIMKGRRPKTVYAAINRFAEQVYRPAALAHVVIDYDDAQVRMNFNAHNTYGEEDATTIAGTRGLLRSRGPRLTEQSVNLYTDAGQASPKLQGHWFENGFQGSMGELLCAIDEDREPEHSARDNLSSLELCFAALASADSGHSVKPGSVMIAAEN